MDILGPAALSDILMAWALHEFHGRHRPSLPPALYDLPPDETRQVALQIHLQARGVVILPMLASHIRECLLVRLYPADIPGLRVMGAKPLTTYSKNKREAPEGGDGSADYVRGLATSGEPIAGPFLAISRTVEGPLTLFDGMHRAAAWVAHVDEGRGYPVEPVYLVLTEWPSPAHELPAS